MASYYIDTSGLVKRYVAEQGSNWIRQVTDPAGGNVVITVTLTGLEMIAAIVRRARGGQLALPTVSPNLRRIRSDWEQLYVIVDVDRELVSQAMDIAETHGLRGYDAVHVAAALRVQRQRAADGLPSITFISADQEQLRVAAAEGLPIDDPNQHA